MSRLELRYVAHITTLTGRLVEMTQAEAGTLRELIAELDGRYPGFGSTFVDPQTGRLRFNVMIYYKEEGCDPITLTDIAHPIRDGSTVTFW